MRFQTILFDLDGTLIDHFIAIHACYAYTLPKPGLPAPTMAQVRNAVGGGLENAMLKFVPASRLDEALKIYRAHWEDILLTGVTLNPGALELLTVLNQRGITCAVLTNKLGHSSRSICDHLGITPLLKGIFGAKDTPWLKPERAFADHALKTLGASAETAMLVGDSPYDVLGAHNAGFPCWVVTTGTHDGAQLTEAKADRVFADLPALHTALLPEL